MFVASKVTDGFHFAMPSRSPYAWCVVFAWLVLGTGCTKSDSSIVKTLNVSQRSVEEVSRQPAEAETTEFDELPAAHEIPGQSTRVEALIAAITIFVLAIFVGFEVITKVPPTLHTPLMSGSNAISGITVVGAVLMAASGDSRWAMFFGFLAVVLASINVVGGFMVTDRMLVMFKRK